MLSDKAVKVQLLNYKKCSERNVKAAEREPLMLRRSETQSSLF